MVELFISQRKDDWERLEKLMELIRSKRVGALSPEEIMELGYLYRRTAADLAIARRDYPGDNVSLYLNQLVARAHAMVYRSGAGEWRGVFEFFRRGFPILFRDTIAYTGLAFGVFAAAAIIGFFAVLLAPDSKAYLVPTEVVASVKDHRMWTGGIGLPSSVMSSVIMTNNIKVALLAFAGGVLFGLLTFFILASNGLMFGSVAGICQAYGMSLNLWSFVAPHGVIELTVIFISGGTGLRLGHALLHPGLHARRESLLTASRQVVRLLLGCVPMLVIAATIEGFVSPSGLLPAAKLAFGGITAILLYGYLLLAGRTRP